MQYTDLFYTGQNRSTPSFLWRFMEEKWQGPILNHSRNYASGSSTQVASLVAVMQIAGFLVFMALQCQLLASTCTWWILLPSANLYAPMIREYNNFQLQSGDTQYSQVDGNLRGLLLPN